MPTVAPEGMWRSMSSRALRSALAEYLKLTWSKSTAPFGTSRSGEAGSLRSVSVSRTSAIRLAEAEAIVTITKIIESIIRLIRMDME